jgi:hypothetical protein
MNECKQCSKELTGRKQYCNDACRMAFSRNPNKPNIEPEQIMSQPEQISQPEHEQPEQSQSEQQPEQPSLEHYHANPTMYATRANPHLLNWGQPMSMHALDKAKLKANRVSIPGDWDYTQTIQCKEVSNVA